jgi:superfamily II DNA or RNA helicase
MSDLFLDSQTYKMRPYQEEAVAATIKAINEKLDPLLIMATGTGKTVVFAEVIKRIASVDRRSLVMAHRNELIDQAIAKISSVAGIRPGKEKAGDVASHRNRIVVASVQTLQRKRLEAWPKDHFRLITVDEAHHAVAKSYQNVLDHFCGNSLLGVTATPDRADERSLNRVFNTVAYEYGLLPAIKDGYLAPIVGKRVKDLEIDLSDLRVVAGDFLESELAGRVELHIAKLAHAIRTETTGKSTLVFMPDVATSRHMALALNELGLDAEYLHGGTDATERSRILYQFSQGQITHLCSCNLLLEGFDEPRVEAIAMLRPTASRPLYAQAVGRGTRLFPGKENLLLVEFTFNSDRLKLVQSFELFATQGFGDRVRERAMQDTQSLESYNILDSLEAARKEQADINRILDGLQKTKQDSVEFVDFDPFQVADLIECDISGEFEIEYQGRILEGPVTPKQQELLARYGVRDTSELDKAQASMLIDAFFKKDWRPYKGEATKGQIWKLRQLGIKIPGLTKAQASILIDRALKEREEKQQAVEF